MLQSQVQTSEALLQDLQKSFSQSQNAVQSRLVGDAFAGTFRRMFATQMVPKNERLVLRKHGFFFSHFQISNWSTSCFCKINLIDYEVLRVSTGSVAIFFPGLLLTWASPCPGAVILLPEEDVHRPVQAEGGGGRGRGTRVQLLTPHAAASTFPLPGSLVGRRNFVAA